MTGRERRQYARYPGASLYIHHDKTCDSTSILQSDLICLDFNRYGMALESGSPMPIGETLSFLIKKNDILSVSIEAAVCYRVKEGQRFIFGVKFLTQDKVSEAFILTAIETDLILAE